VTFSSVQQRLSVRQAQSHDLSQVRRLIEASRCVHLHLDWWTLDDWLGYPTFLVAQVGQHIAGAMLSTQDVAPIAWLRLVAAADDLDADTLFEAILPPMLDALQAQGTGKLVCMAWSEWLADRLPQYGFTPMKRVVVLCKNDDTLPACHRADRVSVRQACLADVDALTAIDHAAFDVEWRYSAATFARALSSSTHFIVAERDGQPIGYASGRVIDSWAHISRLAIHPAHRRQGIGAQVLANLITWLRQNGAEAITLNTQEDNQESLRLYHHFRFALTGETVMTYSHPIV